MTNATLWGQSDAENPHVPFDEEEVASMRPRRGSLLRKAPFVVLALCASSALAATLQVGPTRTYTDIQSAVTAAAGGDTIEVDEGTYTASSGYLFTLNKPVTVKAAGARDKTILRGSGANGAAKVSDAEAVLFGFTFDPNSASVPTLDLSNGVVSNCVFRGTKSTAQQTTLVSGGLLEDVHYTPMEIVNGGIRGGAVKITAGTVRNCTFRGIYTMTYGCSGMALYVAGGLVEGCTIEGCAACGSNQTDGAAGNVLIEGGEVRNCTIRNNGVRSGCAGVYFSAGTLHDSVITGNMASNVFAQTSGGAGVRMTGSKALMYNCVVSRNCTLFDTQKKGYSGVQMSNGTVSNCVVYGNYGGDIYKTGGTVKYTCSGNVVDGEGNVCTDPQLKSPETGDFSLLATAPVQFFDSVAAGIGFSADKLETKAVNGYAKIELTACKTNIAEALTYTWNFGDGSASVTGEKVSHDFAPGVYTVKLTAGDYSCTRTKIIKVAPPICHVWTGGSATIPYDTKEKAAKDFATAYFFGSDEIDVHPGTYGCLDVNSYTAVGRAVHVKGIGAASDVIFTGLKKGNNRAMVVGHPDAIVENVTMTKGATYHNYGGAGVYIGAGLVTNCVITGNDTHQRGAAYLEGGRLTDCKVYSNDQSANGNQGGGVSLESNGVCDNTLICSNKAKGLGGGGAVVNGTDAVLSNCVIYANEAWYVKNDEGGSGGGGVRLVKGLVVNCVITNNTSVRYGGGVYQKGGTLRGCLVADNKATASGVGRGGGVWADAGTVESSTIVKNEAIVAGSGVFLAGATLLNAIVYYNTGDNTSVESGSASYTCSTPVLDGTGNTASDPAFVNAASGNYRLTSLSTAVKNRGSNQTWMDGAKDLDGTDRIRDDTVDMGAWEYVPSASEPFNVNFSADVTSGSDPLEVQFTAEITKYAVADCTFVWDFGDGSAVETVKGVATVTHEYAAGTFTASVTVKYKDSEKDACSQSRKDYIGVSPDTCYVAKGALNTPPYNTWAKAAASVADALKTGANKVYVSNGVYEVTETISLGRAVKLIGVNGPAVTRIRRAASLGNNNLCVMNLSNPDAWLEGVTVSHGRNQTDLYVGGANLRIIDGVVTNCWISEGDGYPYAPVQVDGGLLVDSVISNNFGSSNWSYGGGLAMFGGTVERCRIVKNHSNAGSIDYKNYPHLCAGVYLAGGTIRNSTIAGNYGDKSYSTCGGISICGGTLTHSFVTNNTSQSRQGGVLIKSGTMRNCVVAGNVSESTDAAAGGAGVLQLGGEIDSCTITANSGAIAGSGLKTEGGSVRNTIVWGNGSGANFTNVNKAASVVSCLFADPLFTGADDYRLKPFSPAVDAGTEQEWMEGAKDLADVNRIVGTAPDVGAYEFDGSASGLLCHFDVATERRADYNTVATFAAQVRGAKGAVSYCWTWGDGTAEVLGTANETHVYAPGKYTAKLRVVSGEDEAEESNLVTAIPHEVTVAVGESIAEAIDGGADIIRLAPGTHEISAGLLLGRAVELRSVSGDPADTIIYAPKTIERLRILKMFHAEAKLVGLTLRGGNMQSPNDTQAGSVLWLQDGQVENCIFENGLSYYRGAVWVEGGALRASVIRNSKSTSSSVLGAGLGVIGGLVETCVITNNHTGETQFELVNAGGGAYVADTGILRNSLIVGNQAACGGGVYVAKTASGAVENCTIVGNEAWLKNGVGGGVYVAKTDDDTPPAAVIRNNIVWGNTATVASPELNLPAAFSYSCSSALTAGVNHNVAGDPLFRRPEKGDWRLRGSSPCVGSGFVADWMSGATDLRGRNRSFGGKVSMGAYEGIPAGLSILIR